ncbi:hypothetical protein B0H11DRAFT_1355961 [Mycena galericulata]|nr:hypothetical protein B0H11DRAFT_1355961 [Mycena galericulata]
MADDRHPAVSTSTVSDAPSDSARYDGAFFRGAQHFVVTGGHFTSNIFNPPPSIPPHFPNIPRGHVDLRHEIRMDAGGLVHRQRGRVSRRMYSARIEGGQSDVTVAVYQGQDAKENWKRELAKYSEIWHPNFVQVFGIVSSPGLYATVLHDELVPVGQYMQEYQHSIISTVYLYVYLSGEFQDATHYLETLIGNRAAEIIHTESAIWIRRSIGRLCVELSNTYMNDLFYLWTTPPRIPISVLRGDPESTMICALTLEQYHQTCFTYFGTISSAMEDTRNHNIRLGAVYCSRGDGDQEIAHIPNFLVPDLVWAMDTGRGSLVVMDNGWTRFTPPCDEQIKPSPQLYTSHNWYNRTHGWISQANYIFRQYPITAHYEDYALVWCITYKLKFLPTSEIHPEGYLFLCPPEDLKSEDVGFIERPECPAYWSLDPSGSERLSPEEALAHGFPSFEWERTVLTCSWDERAYAGLSQFHAGKGFDPYSQDIARHLGYPLYQLSCDPSPDRIEKILAEPKLGPRNQAIISEHSQTDDEDAHYDETHQDHQNRSVDDISKTQMYRRLAIRDIRFMILGALGAVLALFSVYYSLAG